MDVSFGSGLSFLATGWVALRLVLGAVFVAAAVFKVRRREQAERFILLVGIPQSSLKPVYLTVLFSEFATGALLVLGAAWPSGAASSMLLFATFIVVLVRARASSPPCACLGASREDLTLARRLAPRVAGFAGSTALAFVPDAGRAPTIGAVAVTVVALTLILRPRWTPSNISTASEHAVAELHDGAAIEPARTSTSPEVTRRGALQHVAGAFTVGALASSSGLGNLLGVSCCWPPCPKYHYCDDRHPTGGCYCEPYPVQTVREVINDPLPPPPPPPPCDCQCRWEECMEGYPPPSHCLGECAYTCLPPPSCPWCCAPQALLYASCMVACTNGDNFWRLQCEQTYRYCCAHSASENQPTDCADDPQHRAPTTLERARSVGRRAGPAAERAWLVTALYTETVALTILDTVAVSDAYAGLRPSEKAFVKSGLVARSEEVLAKLVAYHHGSDDAFVHAGAERNGRLARHALAVAATLPLGPEAETPSSGHLHAPTNPRPVQAGATRGPARPGPGEELSHALRLCATEIETAETIARSLAVPMEAVPVAVAREWSREVRHALRSLPTRDR